MMVPIGFTTMIFFLCKQFIGKKSSKSFNFNDYQLEIGHRLYFKRCFGASSVIFKRKLLNNNQETKNKNKYSI